MGTVHHVKVPQHINFITLGTRDMTSLRAFYRGLGWAERPGSNGEFAAFDAGGVRLALYPLGRLGAEAAPGERVPEVGWAGVTFGMNVPAADDVDETFRLAVAAGGRPVANPVWREWGGYSGYFADPEGNRWEVAWAPSG